MNGAPIVGRPAYRRIEPYRPAGRPIEIDLASNTNLFGPAPSARETLRDAAAPERYPDATSGGLREALAEWLGVDADRVVCGCGSNDVIDAAMRALAEPGEELACAAPTFRMARHFAIANSLRVRDVPAASDLQPDVEGLLATGARMLYVASPNNPTGIRASDHALRKLIDGARGIVLLDEAYVEFSGGSWVGAAAGRENLLVTRTFSKAWGLAGLRVGYAVGSREIVREIEKARGPYKVAALSEIAARAAVEGDRHWLANTTAQAIQARDELAASLRTLGLEPLDSAANFVAVPVPDGGACGERLARAGLGVRVFRDLPGIGDLLRITVGPRQIMARVVETLRGGRGETRS